MWCIIIIDYYAVVEKTEEEVAATSPLSSGPWVGAALCCSTRGKGERATVVEEEEEHTSAGIFSTHSLSVWCHGGVSKFKDDTKCQTVHEQQ